MRYSPSRLLLLSLLLCTVACTFLSGCTLIAEVDRSEIPTGMGGAEADDDAEEEE